MNCQEARELFDLRVDDALDKATAERFDEHLLGCSSCRALYAAVKAESALLRQALQTDLSSTAEIQRIEARVRESTQPASGSFSISGDWILPVLGTVFGLLVLVGARFNGAQVRQAICLSLTPPGGLAVAIPSVLVAGLAILAVILIQSLIFRIDEQN